MLGYKTNMSKFNVIEILCIFFDHSYIKLGSTIGGKLENIQISRN
jgi:hypothetical protein